jgi:hypothetical protein
MRLLCIESEQSLIILTLKALSEDVMGLLIDLLLTSIYLLPTHRATVLRKSVYATEEAACGLLTAEDAVCGWMEVAGGWHVGSKEFALAWFRIVLKYSSLKSISLRVEASKGRSIASHETTLIIVKLV